MFLNPIVKQLQTLEHGLILETNPGDSSSKKNVRFFLLASVYDKPAKAAVLNMKNSNGFWGCTKCLQPGESFTTENSK